MTWEMAIENFSNFVSWITPFATPVSVLIAALTFASGVNAWKREYVGKRRIELAESVLSLLYEVQDAIRGIRNPFSYEGEGTSRERNTDEAREEAQLLDRAHIVFERYRKREKLFADFRSLRYRVMATFGVAASVPFDEIHEVLNDIFDAAQMLGRHYWPRQGRVKMSEEEFKQHLDEMHKHEDVFWWHTSNDEVTLRVNRAVEKFEAIAKRETNVK